MADSYYRTIKGKQYDREILEIVEKASKRSKAPLNKNIAKSIFEAIKDGGDYTDIEKRTLKYIRDNFKFAPDADEYLRTEIRKWAAKISVPAAKKSNKSSSKGETKPAKKTRVTSTSTISRMHEKKESNDTFYHVYDSETEDEIEPTPEYNELVELNRYGKKPAGSSYIRYVFIGILIVAIVCLFFIVRSCRSGNQTEMSDLSSVKSERANSIKSDRVDSVSSPIISKEKKNERVQLLPHTEVENVQSSMTFKSRSIAIRFINELQIRFIKQTLNLHTDAAMQLANLSEALKAYPEIKVRIKGHTCFIGELDENKILSEERAKLIFEELVKRGVNSSQMETRGFGETTSVDTNYSEEGRIKNRRVDFTVLSIN